MKVEVCCADIESVKAAKEAKADRIELCSALEVGGVTPSLGLIEQAVEIFGEGVYVLIRERAGNFVYTRSELEVMQKDIRSAVKAGASGIVIGALTDAGEVDRESLRFLMEAAQDVPVTFHRAFDETSDPSKALEEIISAGCARILTSGQRPSAEEGIPLLKELNCQAGGRIIILPGSGVNYRNAAKILSETGCSEIHASAKENYRDTSKSSAAEILRIKLAIK